MLRRVRRVELGMMVGLLLAAFALRVGGLATTPPGIAFDAPNNLADALRIYQGIPFPLAFDTRPEPLYRWLLAAWYHVGGTSIFSALLLSACIGTLSIALIYRAGRTLFGAAPGAAWGALLAAGALATSMPHLVMSRFAERGILLPLVLLVSIWLWARAGRRARAWAVAGLVTAAAVHTYLAGIAALGWLVGWLVHQAALRPQPRATWRQISAALAGALVALLPWGALILLVPGLFARVQAASDSVAALTLWERISAGLPITLGGLFSGTQPQLLFNLPYTPALHPLFLPLAAGGLVLAALRWRQTSGALLLGGLAALLFPALLSSDPASPIRLVGTLPFLALLAGLGGLGLVRLISGALPQRQPRHTRAWGWLSAALLAGIGLSTHGTYHAFFNDPARYAAPQHIDSIPSNYTLAYAEALDYLAQVDTPTLVPLTALDNPLAYFMLQRAAYPNVTTWARYGLTQLPASTVFYPQFGYYHLPFAPTDARRVLLLPAERTLVILPPLPAAASSIRQPAATSGTPIISPRYGWIIGWTQPQSAEPLPVYDLPPDLPTFGAGLALRDTPEFRLLKLGTTQEVVLEWVVTAPQPADLASVLQLIAPTGDYPARATSQHPVLPYLYPSARWQPGDIIPDLHALTLPTTLTAGWYRWGAGVAVLPNQDQRLTVQQPPVLNPLPTLRLWGTLTPALPPTAAPPPAPAQMLDVLFANGLRLRALDEQMQADHWDVTLYWEAETLLAEDYTLFVHALDASGALLAQADGLPNGGADPTWTWLPGRGVVTQHSLPLTSTPAAVRVGLYHPVTLARVPLAQGGDTVTVRLE